MECQLGYGPCECWMKYKIWTPSAMANQCDQKLHESWSKFRTEHSHLKWSELRIVKKKEKAGEEWGYKSSDMTANSKRQQTSPVRSSFSSFPLSSSALPLWCELWIKWEVEEEEEKEKETAISLLWLAWKTEEEEEEDTHFGAFSKATLAGIRDGLRCARLLSEC